MSPSLQNQQPAPVLPSNAESPMDTEEISCSNDVVTERPAPKTEITLKHPENPKSAADTEEVGVTSKILSLSEDKPVENRNMESVATDPPRPTVEQNDDSSSLGDSVSSERPKTDLALKKADVVEPVNDEEEEEEVSESDAKESVHSDFMPSEDEVPEEEFQDSDSDFEPQFSHRKPKKKAPPKRPKGGGRRINKKKQRKRRRIDSEDEKSLSEFGSESEFDVEEKMELEEQLEEEQQRVAQKSKGKDAESDASSGIESDLGIGRELCQHFLPQALTGLLL